MKLMLAILPFLGCTAALGIAPVSKTSVPAAKPAATTKVTIQSMLKNIWNNGGEQTTDGYSYNVGYGRLTWGEQNIQGFFPAVKSEISEGNFDGAGGSIVDWGGDRLTNTVANEMFMFKIKATKDIEIKVGGDGEGALAGWIENTQLNYYNIEGDIVNGLWYQDRLVKTIDMTPTTSYADISYTATVKAGNTFVFEWGAHESSGRNWQNFATMFFEITTQTAKDVLPMSSIVTDVISSNGADVQKNLVSYNVKHGLVASNNVTNFDGYDGGLTTSTGNATAYNWRISSRFNDGIVFLFNVKKYSAFTVWREQLGTGNEWLGASNVRIYINNSLEKSVTFESDTPDLTDFDFSKNVKAGDQIAWEYSFEWADARNMSMKNGGDIVKSLPQFSFEAIEHTHSFGELGNGQAATCTEAGWKDYTTCDCGLYAEDTAGEHVIGDKVALEAWKAGAGKIAPTGHTFSEATYSWSEDNSTCTASHECSVCHETETETVNATVTHVVEATCDHDGEDRYDVTFTKTGFTAQSKTVTVPQKEHNLLLVQGTPATCTTAGFKDYYRCSVCDNYFEDAEGTVKIEDLVAWKIGAGKIEPLGHEFGEPTYTWADDNSTCTATRRCTRPGCSEIETETVKTVEKDGKIVATFTNPAFAQQTKDKPSNTALVVGLAVGGAAVVAAAGVGAFFLIRKKRLHK